MKTIALALALVAIVSAQGPSIGGPSLGGALAAGPTQGGARAGGAAAAGGLGAGPFGNGFGTPRNYGPKVYGLGVNNRWALPPNPFKMQRALALVNQVPEALLRLDLDGDITITNRYGQDADILHPLGFDLGELIE